MREFNKFEIQVSLKLVVITAAQLLSAKLKLKFCASYNPASSKSGFVMVRVADNSLGWK